MKKVLLTLALAAFAFAANAQFVLGGNISVYSDGGTTIYDHVDPVAAGSYNYLERGYNGVNYNSITFMPKIGYNINDNMQVGAKFGLQWIKTKDFTGYRTERIEDDTFEGWYSTTSMAYVFAPYFRYNFATADKFTFFCEAQVTLSFTPNGKAHLYNSAYTDALGFNHPEIDEDVVGYSYKSISSSLTVVPGINYQFNDKFSADLYIDLLGLGFNHFTSTTINDFTVPGRPDDIYETDVTTNSFYLTANTDAQTLADHLNLFRLGFNYHF